MEKIYSCEQVAERYSVKLSTVWRWIRNKKLRAFKTGKKYAVSEGDLMRFEDEARAASEAGGGCKWNP